MPNNLCHCGQPLHYTDPKVQSQVNEIVKKFGPYMDVIVESKTYRVQRHYIALHGIKGKDVGTLGFQEVTK